jgi:hypothetical protein
MMQAMLQTTLRSWAVRHTVSLTCMCKGARVRRSVAAQCRADAPRVPVIAAVLQAVLVVQYSVFLTGCAVCDNRMIER